MRGIEQMLMGFIIGVFALAIFIPTSTLACTTICLKGDDGAVVCGRTMEWGTFNLRSRVTIIPRGHAYVAGTPDGKKGVTWQTRYGIVGLDMMEQDTLADGINEKGLYVTALYHPGFADYAPYDPAQASISMGPNDWVKYVLSQFATVEEVPEGLKKVRVVAILEPIIGNITPPLHLAVTDQTGKSIVVEYLKGQLTIFDNPLHVMTNSPSYDWHMTNLRNYINLSTTPFPAKKMGGVEFAPIGAGSGLLGIPGDYTPPSRFIRAVYYTQMARRTPDGPETLYEVFRILDSFNLPLGSAEGSGQEERLKGMRSATIWTSAADTKNLVYYYHTQHNRRVRMVNLKGIDFSPNKKGMIHIPLDKQTSQDIDDVTPKK